MAAPSCEISNQILEELKEFKKLDFGWRTKEIDLSERYLYYLTNNFRILRIYG